MFTSDRLYLILNPGGNYKGYFVWKYCKIPQHENTCTEFFFPEIIIEKKPLETMPIMLVQKQ